MRLGRIDFSDEQKGQVDSLWVFGSETGHIINPEVILNHTWEIGLHARLMQHLPSSGWSCELQPAMHDFEHMLSTKGSSVT